jgi:very-short-patch-repair endonuclease
LDAIKDGIRTENPKRAGELTRYYPKCCVCGKEMLVFNYKHGMKYTCKECRLKAKLRDRDTKINEDYDLKERKFNNAVTRIKGMTAYTQDYERAAGIVHKKLHRPLWFQSTEEIMVAIELVKNKIKARHQVQFGKYRADFVLPEESVVLEVDGAPFHNNFTRDKENLRDNLIEIALGSEWEVIRIGDSLINKNIKGLIPALITIKLERKKIRFQNNGGLPNWYTGRII